MASFRTEEPMDWDVSAGTGTQQHLRTQQQPVLDNTMHHYYGSNSYSTPFWNFYGEDCEKMQLYMSRLNSLVRWKEISVEDVEIPSRKMCIKASNVSDKQVIEEIDDMKRSLARDIVSTHIQIAFHQESAARDLVKSKQGLSFAKVFWDETSKAIRIHAKTLDDLETMKSIIFDELGLNQHSSVRDTQTQTKYDNDKQDQQPFLKTYKFHERLHVHVYSCDILEAKTDAIVNAANEHLEHAAGVASFIAEKAGRALTEESNDIVRKHKLRVTDVVSTTAGYLPHTAVLHAIGPRWKDYRKKKDCLEDLKQTIKNILYTAEKKYYRSVAIPSISGGLFGVPKDLCGEMYALAVDEFQREKRTPVFLKEIHFVDLDTSMLMLIKDGFEKLFSGALKTPLEQRHPNIVWLDVDLNQHSSVGDTQTQTKYDKQDQQPFLKTYKFHERLHVHVYSCDILEAKTDAIVNAANEHLEHAAGVASLIAEKAGRALTEESKDIVRKHRLSVTDVVSTTAGRLPHTAVLHAIGPRWKDYRKKKDCLEDLKTTIKHILYKAEKRCFRSVAIPSISAGLFGVPKDLCGEMYALAVDEFQREKRTPVFLKEIHFVDLDTSMLMLIKDGFEKLFSGALKTPLEQRHPNIVWLDVDLNQHSSVGDTQTQTKYDKQDQQPFLKTYKFHERLHVHVYSCDILEAKTDAIVNAANEHLEHAAGVASLIAEKAGRALTEESKDIVRKHRLSVTDVVSTTAGRLPHTAVLHAIGPRWKDYRKKKDCLEDLKTTIKHILYKAEKRCFRSVAIPSISAGLFGVPKDLCGEMYALAVDEFQREKRTPVFLKEIHFVDLDTSMLMLIKDGFEKLFSGALKTPLEQRHPNIVWLDVDLNQHSSVGDTQTQTKYDKQDQQPFLKTYKFHERLHVHVYSCDILEAKTDAIVNAANEHLEHAAGVASLIAEKAGRALTEESKDIVRKHRLSVTDVVSTTAGRLPHTAVLHAIGPRWKDYRKKKDCLEDLKQTIKNILYTAEKKYYRSVAIPSISSGFFGVPKDLCGEMYALAIDEFLKEKPPPLFLEEIHFIDLDTSMLEKIKAGFENMKSGVLKTPMEKRYPDIKWIDFSSGRSYAATVSTKSAEPSTNEYEKHSAPALNMPSSKSTSFLVKRSNVQTKTGILVTNFEFKNKLKIKIFTGSIVRFHGDAIIISSDQNITGLGALGNAVQVAGGKSYEKEFDKIRKQLTVKSVIKVGDTFHCKGGDMNAKYVMHVVLNQLYDTRHPKLTEHKAALSSALEKADELKLTKVAMPLIGAGFIEKTLKDLQRCCTALFEVVSSFCSHHEHDCHLEELHFINRNSKITSALIDVFNANCDSTGISSMDNKQAQVVVKTAASGSDRGHSEKSWSSAQHGTNHSRSFRDSQSGGGQDSTRSRSSANFEKFGARPKEHLRWSHSTPSSFTEEKSPSKVNAFQHTTAPTGQPGNLVFIESDSDDSGEKDASETSDIESKSLKSKDEDESAPCVICLCEITDGMKLDCGHEFCRDCLQRSFKQHKQACPVCGTLYGIVKGNQPKNGTMNVQTDPYSSLPGFEGYGTITIKYLFPSGIQGPEHPNPRQPYEGTERRGFLPDNEEGRKVLRLLKKAFDRRLVFTIGYSRTTGKDNVVTWNDIHHKTKRNTGAQNFGYPDPTYLQRVQEELAAKGVTE